MHLNEWQLRTVLGDDARHLGPNAECQGDCDVTDCSYCGHAKGVICAYCGHVGRELTADEQSRLRRASSVRSVLTNLGEMIVGADRDARGKRQGPFVTRYAILGISTLRLRLFLDDGTYVDTAGPLGRPNWD